MAFYITLPSNSSLEFYPDNVLCHYTTRLPKAMDLEGAWEVALTEVYVPRSWYTFKGQSIMYYDDTYGGNVYVKDGYYRNMKELTSEIEKKLSELFVEHIPKFQYCKITNKLSMHMPPTSQIEFSGDLRYILGFKDKIINHDPDDHELITADKVSDISAGINSIYIYTNLTEPVIVGDTQVPLLKNIPILHSDKNVIHRAFDKYTYIPLQKKQFESIEVVIADSTGRKIPFISGDVSVTLHFRKV